MMLNADQPSIGYKLPMRRAFMASKSTRWQVTISTFKIGFQSAFSGVLLNFGGVSKVNMMLMFMIRAVMHKVANTARCNLPDWEGRPWSLVILGSCLWPPYMVHECFIFMVNVGAYAIHGASGYIFGQLYSDLTNQPKAPKLGSTLVTPAVFRRSRWRWNTIVCQYIFWWLQNNLQQSTNEALVRDYLLEI